MRKVRIENIRHYTFIDFRIRIEGILVWKGKDKDEFDAWSFSPSCIENYNHSFIANDLYGELYNSAKEQFPNEDIFLSYKGFTDMGLLDALIKEVKEMI